MGRSSISNISAGFAAAAVIGVAGAYAIETRHEIEGDVLGVAGCNQSMTYAESANGARDVLSSSFYCEGDKGDDIWVWDARRGDVVSLKLDEAVATAKLPVPGTVVQFAYTSNLAQDALDMLSQKEPNPFMPPVQFHVKYEDLAF